MSFDGQDRQWKCGKAGAVNLQLLSSIVRDIQEPCLHQSPSQGSKMLKPEKWRATFDSDGKVLNFQKALKLIVIGGVDPSIRAEVWEFLLGCYALSSTAEYRRQLRMARRERYADLIRQCQTMHSSIGTGNLAYAVGSKVLDMRLPSKDNGKRDAEFEHKSTSHDTSDEVETYRNKCIESTDTPYTCQREISSSSADLVSVIRESTDTAAYDSSYPMPSSGPYDCFSSKSGREENGSEYVTESCFDFPPLPVTCLFERSHSDREECGVHNNKVSTEHRLSLSAENMHSFQINNNVDLIIESNAISHASNSEIEMCNSDFQGQVVQPPNVEYKTEIVSRLRISDVPQTAMIDATASQGGSNNEDKVSEWLWTLHQIVVDVVRTDSHLEFYENMKNVARMSDILAVYAWVDPATGYCQGMSDLLSPFVVLYEDNADAFWCFEMLLRRMRENFQMEGPTGVMKQLEALWCILAATDREMFVHLSLIGAESLHFAFRMLLVLFRRELSFNEALCMWEMMWAADFDVSVARELEENCPESLVVKLPINSGAETGEESSGNGNGNSKGVSQSKHGNVQCSVSDNFEMKSVSRRRPLCGLTRNFWSRNDHINHMSTVVTSTRTGDDELAVFCVAAILIINRQKIIKEAHLIDDLIKMFNDKMLKINVKRCIRTAVKLRKKYFYKLIRQNIADGSEQ
ncbi:small G protein signaling modulator 1-like isoform X2 [Telopea speciosissima]|uniref:small G protein signaling modulator 1-like isoform X2 n=1 Tax=Telopea speciosissima TaxID=54955 RepID=UPI001CC80486|nr:small G protein signaling modulator 1-like isoform X2 [Telopea speciosissima]